MLRKRSDRPYFNLSPGHLMLRPTLLLLKSVRPWGWWSERRAESLGHSVLWNKKGTQPILLCDPRCFFLSSIHFFALFDMPSCTWAVFLRTAAQGGSFWRIPDDHYGPHYYYIKSIKEHTCTSHWFDLELTKASIMCNYKKLNDPFILNVTSVAPNMLWWIAHYV